MRSQPNTNRSKRIEIKSVSSLSEIHQQFEEAINNYDVVNDTGINECFKMMERLEQIPEDEQEKNRVSDPNQFRYDSELN